MKKTTKRTKLALHQETLKQLNGTKLDQIAAGAAPGVGGQPKTVAEFSGGPMCTGGPACTFNWTCSHGCR